MFVVRTVEELWWRNFWKTIVFSSGTCVFPRVQADGLLHTTCGTPNYVAPEVINDKGYHGATADLWSCGVIMFVLMAGYLPFDEPNLMTLYRKVCIHSTKNNSITSRLWGRML